MIICIVMIEVLRELGKDPLLRGYSVIMVDEAHERTTATDLILGLLKKLIKLRTDLRLVISSATLDAELFKNFFELNDTDDPSKDTSIIVGVDGRMYPVDVFYSAKPCRHIVMEAMETVLKIHETQKKGDVLVFLTGNTNTSISKWEFFLHVAISGSTKMTILLCIY